MQNKKPSVGGVRIFSGAAYSGTAPELFVYLLPSLLFQTIIQSDCILRGDLANVRIGRQCVISKRSVIRPPFKKFSKGFVYLTPSKYSLS